MGMSTAPIPALAPVIRTVLPGNLDALKTDMDKRVNRLCPTRSRNDALTLH